MSKPATRVRTSLRGGPTSRLEALTDAVFGFAITLLVVSLEVPTSFDVLLAAMRGFVAFGASFAILMMVWIYHYKFFKRYDLEDGVTILLNSVLLFVVLMYVYPLKFVFSAWLNRAAGVQGIDSWADLRLMFVIYGVGYCAVFIVFALLYLHAYRRRASLELTLVELIDTREHIASCLVMVGVGLASVVAGLVAPDNLWSILPGPMYMLIGPVQWIVGRHYTELKAQQESASAREMERLPA